MSAITNSPFATGSSPAIPSFDFERGGSALPAALSPTYRANDGITFDASNRLPIAFPPPGTAGGYTDPQVNGGRSQFASIVSQLLGSVSSLFAAIASYLGGSRLPTNPDAGAESHFTNATASSTGDPHEAFHGTTDAGKTLDSKWDSMTSHDDLLSSHSFDGGYRVSNAVTQANGNGVTMNDRVTVATDGGNTSVTMNRDGSYDVTSYGREVALQTGVATHLGDGETVTKNVDGSLTIDDADGRGGSIETTLRSNGAGGVDATNSATNVDLGGYLVNQTDDGYGVPGYGAPMSGPPKFALPPIAAGISVDPNASPTPAYGTFASDAIATTQPYLSDDAATDGVIEA